MKKPIVVLVMFIALVFLFFTFTPNVWSQSKNVEVLSYSWYISDLNSFIVIGEIQNVGSNNIEYIALTGRVNSSDGEDQAWSTTTVYSNEILPQQKAPFLMYFFADNSYSREFSWASGDLDNVEFNVIVSDETDNYQYPDLEIVNDSHQIDSNGGYTVTGTILNKGNQTTGKLWVVATFYNSTGSVIATGFSDYLTPDYLQADQTTSFIVNTVDAVPELSDEMAVIADKITVYSLLIQTEEPIIPEFPSLIILLVLMVSPLFVMILKKKVFRSIQD